MADHVTLYLYTTVGCHLCEQAQAIAAPVLENSRFILVPTEIAEDETLMDQYGIRIPVVKRADTGQELGWPFNSNMLEVLLAE